MSDTLALEAENVALRLRLADAEAALRALSLGEVDSFAAEVGATPTLLRAAQDQLRDSANMLRAVFDNTSDSLVVFDDSGVFLDVNPATCELYGRPRDELVGHIGAEYYVGFDAEAARSRLHATGNQSGELQVRRKDGSLRLVEYTAKLNIVPGRHLVLFRDVTERGDADSRRRHLAAIVDSADDAIIGTDANGIVTSWNPSAERLFQWAASEAIGRSIAFLLPDDRREGAEARIAAVLRGEVVRNRETTHVRKDGSLVPTALTSSPLTNEAGQVVGTARIVRDMSEAHKAAAKLREAEERLRQAQKMEAIGLLAGGVAHDFNNVLSAILGFTYLVLSDLKPDDPIRSDIEEIGRAGTRAMELTRQVLAFGRKQVLQPQVMDLGEAVMGMKKMLKRLLGDGIELSLIATSGEGRVLADPSQVEQVVMNLAVNARDAMPGGGNLTLETINVEVGGSEAGPDDGVPPGRYAMLSVTDTGHGMDPATRERIFEPFFTTKELGKGTGLGLSTVFGIVTQSGGHVRVESEPGRGTTFRVYLPRVEQPLRRATVPPPAPVTLRGTETVLLVEDEEQVRLTSRAILERHGYKVVDAVNGGEALLVCEQFAGDIHLLISDVVMPRMTGKQLAERLAPMRPKMKVLYVSGYTEEGILHHGVLEAGIAFLAKPITPSSLLLKVREVLDARDTGP